MQKMKPSQKTEIIDKCEKDGWIYTLRKVLTCYHAECKCNSGEYHDWQYVFEKRKYSTNPAKSLGDVNDIGFPPKIIHHRLSDEEEAQIIKDKVEVFINNLKTNSNGKYAHFTDVDWEILDEKYSIFLKIKQQTGRTIQKLFNRGKKDTTELMRKSYIAMRELENTLNQTQKPLLIKDSDSTDKYINKEVNYEDLLQQI